MPKWLQTTPGAGKIPATVVLWLLPATSSLHVLTRPRDAWAAAGRGGSQVSACYLGSISIDFHDG